MLAESNHVDEADAVEPNGDASDNAFGVIPIFDGLQCGVVDDFEVFGFELEIVGLGIDFVEGRKCTQCPFDNIFNVLIFRHVDCLLEGFVDGGCDGSCFGGESHVAAAECKAVFGADDGAGDKFDGVLDLLEEVANHCDLLEIFFAKVCALWLCEVEKTANNNSNSGEMAGATRAFHYFFDRAEVIGVVDGFGVHLLNGGDEGHELAVDGFGSFEACDFLEVGVDGARIFLEVFLVVELNGVDEETHYHEVVFFAGTGDEGQVAFVKCTHGGNEAYGQMVLLCVVDCFVEGSHGSYFLHCMLESYFISS